MYTAPETADAKSEEGFGNICWQIVWTPSCAKYAAICYINVVYVQGILGNISVLNDPSIKKDAQIIIPRSRPHVAAGPTAALVWLQPSCR